jgi:hypothetical protein
VVAFCEHGDESLGFLKVWTYLTNYITVKFSKKSFRLQHENVIF